MNALAKYSKGNFAVEILSEHDTEVDALNEEAKIVDEEYVEREDTVIFIVTMEKLQLKISMVINFKLIKMINDLFLVN